jgi:hypothetical protein
MSRAALYGAALPVDSEYLVGKPSPSPRPAHNIFHLSCEIQSSKCVTGVTTQALHEKTYSAIHKPYFAPGGRSELLIKRNPFQLMLMRQVSPAVTKNG